MSNPEKPLSVATLPQELIEMIISYIYNVQTLRSFSMASCFFRQLALPALYHTLTLTNDWEKDRKRWLKSLLGLLALVKIRKKTKDPYEWSNPLLELDKLSYLDHVERLAIQTFYPSRPFTAKQLDGGHNLLYFSALKNLRELRIEHLLLSSFMPNIQRYFGHLAPTLQSLALKNPKASCRQILCFIGLFPKLRDLKLVSFGRTPEDGTPVTHAPLSKPPLDGWLALGYCKGEEFVDDMIALYGNFRFRYVSLYSVEYIRRVLDECVDTLETLQLEPKWSDDYTTDLSRDPPLNLENHKSLRTLNLKATSLPTDRESTDVGSLNTLLSLIKSPLLDVVIVYEEFHFSPECTQRSQDHVGYIEESEKRTGYECSNCDACWKQFQVLNEARKARNFRLVLYVDAACENEVETLTRALELHVEAHRCGELHSLLSDSLIISPAPSRGYYNVARPY